MHCSCGHPIAAHQQLNCNANVPLSNNHAGTSTNNNLINSNTFINERSIHPFCSDPNNSSFSTPPPPHVQTTRAPTSSECDSFIRRASQPSTFESINILGTSINQRMDNQLREPNNASNAFNNNHPSAIAQPSTNSILHSHQMSNISLSNMHQPNHHNFGIENNTPDSNMHNIMPTSLSQIRHKMNPFAPVSKQPFQNIAQDNELANISEYETDIETQRLIK